MGIRDLPRRRGLDLADVVAIRRRRALILGGFSVLGLTSAPALSQKGGLTTGVELSVAVQAALMLVNLTVATVCLWRRERLGERSFLAVQLLALAGMVPSLLLTTPPGSLRSSELVLLAPLVMGAVFLESRWSVAVVAVGCVLGANAVTLHRLSQAPDAPAEVFGEIVVFGLIAVVVRALRESAFEAVRAARHGEITDPLTGLPNRRGFERVASSAWGRRSADRKPVALLVLDVDHFKRVNDTFGHAAGDQLLCRLADVLRANLRPEDVAVRLGGEEFAVLAPVEPGQAEGVAERLRRALEAELAPVTVSIGVVEAVPEPTHEPTAAAEALWRAAETADAGLYEAKRTGRNRVVLVP